MTRRFLSACLIVKDEARYLLEWIAFHRVVGFEFFYIYDNDSTDDTAALLAPLERHGICRRIPWSRADYPDNPQMLAYRDALARYGHETEWMAIIDADEFIVPLTNVSVAAILREHFAGAPSVLVNWRIFGSAGLMAYDPRPCIDRFRRASAPNFHANTNVKAIVRPGTVETAWIHNHYLTAGSPVLSDGHALDPPREQRTPGPVYGHLQVNHYFCKSRAEFMAKRLKGLADFPLDAPNALRALEMFEDADRNEIEEGRAVAFLGDTEAEMARLAGLGPVTPAHEGEGPREPARETAAAPSHDVRLYQGFGPGMKILEVRPGEDPIFPRGLGWNGFRLELATDPGAPGVQPGSRRDEVEAADFLWRDGPMLSAVPADHHGTFDAVVASHVIEHIPDPIAFFAFCSRVTTPQGQVLLVVPDKRRTFDFFRGLTDTAAWLEANRQGRTKHSRRLRFEYETTVVHSPSVGEWSRAKWDSLEFAHHDIFTARRLFDAIPDPEREPYVDMHGSVFTPSSFALMMWELHCLGEIDFAVTDIEVRPGIDFIVNMRRTSERVTDRDLVQARRLALLKQTFLEVGEQFDAIA